MMHTYGVEFISLMVVFGLAAILPGVDFTIVVRQSIAYGRKVGILTSLGIACAIFVHASYTILGVGLIISKSILLFNLIRFLGAAYLLYLGVKTFMAPAPATTSVGEMQKMHTQCAAKSFGIGFLTNLLNPKATLFFVSVFTTLVSIHTPGYIQFVYVLGMSFVLFSWFLLVSLFFTTEKIRLGFYRLGKWFNRITGLALIGLAARVALSEHK